MQGLRIQAPDVDRILEVLYEDATRAEGTCFWCSVLARLCAAFDAPHALAGRTAGDQTVRILHQYQRPRPLNERPSDPWHGSGIDPLGLVLSPGSRRMLCTFAGHSAGPALVGLWRTGADPEFSEAEREAFASLARHLARAAVIREALETERRRYDRASAMLESMPIPVLMANRCGRILYLNRMAKDLMAHADGLVLREGRTIAADTSPAAGDLRRALAHLAAAQGQVGTSVHVTVPRRASDLPLLCTISQVPSPPPDLGEPADPVLAIIITDPHKGQGRECSDFTAAYRLTRAETRLVRLLADGLGLFEAAERLGISRNTARTHMRNIHAKAGTRRQTDLIRMLERFNPFEGTSRTAGHELGARPPCNLTPRGDERSPAGD